MAGQIPTLYETAAENGIDTYELVPGKAMGLRNVLDAYQNCLDRYYAR